MNANYLQVNIADGKVRFSMIPDDVLKSLVHTQEPKESYDKLPPIIKENVENNVAIPLNMSRIAVIDGDVFFVED